MARGREGIAKRERERRRQLRQEQKRARRDAAEPGERLDEVTQGRLMEEFRVLSERNASGDVSISDFEAERARILEELGISGGAGYQEPTARGGDDGVS